MTEKISIVGGKGGTGKTLIAVNLAYLLSLRDRTLLVDADADNPCIKPFFEAEKIWEEEVAEFRPRIMESVCTLCGKCVAHCPEHALALIPGKRTILIESLCSGCGVCRIICPANAIKDSWIKSGSISGYAVNDRLELIVGELTPTCKRSATIIMKALETAEKSSKGHGYVVVDAPPGTGAGIYSIIKFSDIVMAVTEPTPLGLNDLKKLYRLFMKFFSDKQLYVIVNKHGLPGGSEEDLRRFLKDEGISWLKVPYDDLVVESYVAGRILVKDYPSSRAAEAIKKIAEEI